MLSISRDFLLSLFNNVSPLEEECKNKYSGRCFIIGNGPSISNQNLNILENEFTFVTNRFILNPNFGKIKPSFYCISDPVFLNKQNNIILKNICQSLKNDDVNNLFVSNRFRLDHSFQKMTPAELTYYIYMKRTKEVFLEKEISTNVKNGFYYAGTVIIDICIPLAFYMGFEKVYLLGCESDYSNHNTHFYGSVEEVKTKAKDLSREDWFDMINTSYGYARKYFENSGREIIDCSLHGKLTTLQKAEYSQIT